MIDRMSSSTTWSLIVDWGERHYFNDAEGRMWTVLRWIHTPPDFADERTRGMMFSSIGIPITIKTDA